MNHFYIKVLLNSSQKKQTNKQTNKTQVQYLLDVNITIISTTSNVYIIFDTYLMLSTYRPMEQIFQLVKHSYINYNGYIDMNPTYQSTYKVLYFNSI